MTASIRILVLGYLALVLALTLLPIFGVEGDEPITLHLVPFEDLRNALATGRVPIKFALLAIGNTAMFMPLGVLIPAVRAHVSALLVGGAALLLSTVIELTQLAISLLLGHAYRTANVDDVILNVAGALLGYAGLKIWVGAR